MSTGGYKIINKEAIHFVTFAVTEWVDVFTRREYKDILIESIKYCQKEKAFFPSRVSLPSQMPSGLGKIKDRSLTFQ